MHLRTHLKASPDLVGKLIRQKPGYVEAELITDQRMQVDSLGLIHGGFIFGLADLAAMWAVNQPTVVLGSAAVKFKAPVKVGTSLTAIAKVIDPQEHKVRVDVKIYAKKKLIFTGEFKCVILKRHVLENT